MNHNAHVDKGEIKTLREAGITELSVENKEERDADGNLFQDIDGNIVGLVGQFKMLVEDAAGKLVETIGKMIDVLFKTT
jgi:hypothetical protein